jgi:phospholipid/cholesterol/gamma-HCH transport system permease protein
VSGSALLDPVQRLGRSGLDGVTAVGRFGVFLGQALFWLMVPPFRLEQLVRRISFIGVRSLSVILLTGLFTGMVLGLQGVIMLRRVGSEAFVGPAVAISLIRELGPVLAALMVTGRAGSALAAEIGVMRITEQIDALTVMALNPMRYLVVPSGTYFGQIQTFLSPSDIWVGSWKSLAFGLLVTWVATYKGYYVGHGAEGVGRATTEAVVLASVLILVLDYFMGAVLP